MKIKNLAFFGVMASILGVGGAAYATDATIIASKAYVDARDNLKEDVSNKETATYANSTNKTSTTVYPSMHTLDSAISNLSSTIGTDALSTNVLADGVDETKLTKASAITAAKSTAKLTTVTDGVASMGNGDDTHFATTKAIADTFKDLDHKTTATNATNASTAVTTVSQADGQVTVTNGTLGIAAIDSAAKELAQTGTINQWNSTETDSDASGYVTDNKFPTVKAVAQQIEKATASIGSAETNNVVTSTNIGYLTKVSAIQAGIAKQGSTNSDWNTVTDTDTGAGAHLYDAKQNTDNFVPTVAAVERRIDNETSSMTDSSTSATYTASSTTGAGTLAIATADSAGNQGKFATSSAVATTATNIKNYTDDKIAGVTATVNNLDLTALQATGSGEAVVSVTQTDGQIAVAKNTLTFSGAMNSGLSEINTVGGNYSSSCTTSNPCVLTMVMNGSTPTYEWTSMDTDSLTGQI